LIRIVDPTLVVLVGAAGSGKSTLAARLFAPDEILSSDAFRAMAGARGGSPGDPADQRLTRAAFSILHRELERRLRERRTTVVDATNVTAFARRSLVRRAAAANVPAVAIVLDLDDLLVLSRNATRAGRIVPEEVVRRHLADIARSARHGFADEGFDAVHPIRTAEEQGQLSIERVPRAR
jgi:predicted kinase